MGPPRHVCGGFFCVYRVFRCWVFSFGGTGCCGRGNEPRKARNTRNCEGLLAVMDRRNLVQKKHSYGKCGSQHVFSYKFCEKSMKTIGMGCSLSFETEDIDRP